MVTGSSRKIHRLRSETAPWCTLFVTVFLPEGDVERGLRDGEQEENLAKLFQCDPNLDHLKKVFKRFHPPPKFPKLLSHQWLPHKCCGIKGGGAFKWHRSWIWAYWNEWQIMDLLRVRPWDFWPTGANSPTQGQATLGLGPQGGGSGPGWAYGLCTTLLLEFKFFED